MPPPDSGIKDVSELCTSRVHYACSGYHPLLQPKLSAKHGVKLLTPPGSGKEMPLDTNALQPSQKLVSDLKPHTFTWEKYSNH